MAFITEVKGGKPIIDINPLLENVRKEHKVLKAVIDAFGNKVDVLVEKQRSEYTQAYEYHMIDVQRELYILREKATAIANDTTREEKLKKLDADQKWFKNEALRLDIETNEYRKKLRDTKSMIQSAERERDWLLAKLRSAKNKYKTSKSARALLGDVGEGPLSVTSTSNDDSSAYSIEIIKNESKMGSSLKLKGFGPFSQTLKKEINWRNKLDQENTILRTTPQPGTTNTKQFSHTAPARSQQLSPIRPATSSKREQTEQYRKCLADLVAARACQSGLRDFVAQCAYTSESGVWSKQSRRSFQDISLDWRPENAHADALELALCPETYYILSRIIVEGQIKDTPLHAEGTRDGDGGTGTNTGAGQECHVEMHDEENGQMLHELENNFEFFQEEQQQDLQRDFESHLSHLQDKETGPMSTHLQEDILEYFQLQKQERSLLRLQREEEILEYQY